MRKASPTKGTVKTSITRSRSPKEVATLLLILEQFRQAQTVVSPETKTEVLKAKQAKENER
jgi:hypothetical protein